jgi:hypothetical protein
MTDNCSYCGDEDAAYIKRGTTKRLCQTCASAFTDGQLDPKAELDDVTDDGTYGD